MLLLSIRLSAPTNSVGGLRESAKLLLTALECTLIIFSNPSGSTNPLTNVRSMMRYRKIWKYSSNPKQQEQKTMNDKERMVLHDQQNRNYGADRCAAFTAH